jgi:alkyl sulfatase BDS1-like metallo-beta-lactamase superfamily hydrolase
MQRAQADFDLGDYRWVAEVMKHAVYADPSHQGARELAAAALEQMGFQAESATWRNAYLLGAHEYRKGPPATAAKFGSALLGAVSNALLFDVIAVRVNAPKAEGLAFSMAWHFTDLDEHWLLELSNGALSSLQVDSATPASTPASTTPPPADVSLSLTRATLEGLLTQQLAAPAAVAQGLLKVSGKPGLLVAFFGLLDRFHGNFPVVDAASEPK